MHAKGTTSDPGNDTSALPLTILLLGLLALFMSACAASPRFSPEVEQALRAGDMQRLTTPTTELYYPAARRDEALRIGARVEACLREAEERMPTPSARRERLVVILLDAALDNEARVHPGEGADGRYLLLPMDRTSTLEAELGVLPDPAHQACQLAIQYAQLTEIRGVHVAAERVLGGSVNPQLGLGPWFQKGLAIWTASRLDEGNAQLDSPLWRQSFAAAVAEEGLPGARLHPLDAHLPFDGPALAGSHFVEWLAERYGETTLWAIVQRQSHALLPVLGASGRIQAETGEVLAVLFREWREELLQTHRPRQRPAEQSPIREAGREARFALSAQGHVALLYRELDQPPRLEVFDPEGRRILRRRLPDLLPPRRFVESAPETMAFDAEGRSLWVMGPDRGSVGQRVTLLRVDLERRRVQRVARDLRGRGGDVRGDGAQWVYVRAEGARSALVLRELRGGEEQVLWQTTTGTHLAWPRFSPDGRRIALVHLAPEERRVVVVDVESGARQGVESGPWPSWPAWRDGGRLVHAERSADGTQQIRETELLSGASVVRTAAPWLATQPQVSGDALWFLNLEGTGYTLDRVLLGSAVGEEIAQDLDSGSTEEPADRRDAEGADEDAAPEVLRDGPYRAGAGLLVPRMRAAYVYYAGVDFGAGATVEGRDELGVHNWAAWAEVAARNDWRLPWELSWLHTGFAPLRVGVSGGDQWTRTRLRMEEGAPRLDLRSRGVGLGLERVFSGSPLRLDLALVQREAWVEEEALARPADPLEHAGAGGEGEEAPEREGLPSRLLDAQRLTGGQLGYAWQSARHAPWRGEAPALGASLAAGAWMRDEVPSEGFVDLRAQLDLRAALLRRTRVQLELTGRTLRGGDPLPLIVGGHVSGDALLQSRVDRRSAMTWATFRGVRFSERVRGFEDVGAVAQEVAHADLSWVWRIPTEARSVAGGRVLPATGTHNLHVGLFGSGYLSDRDEGAALGGTFELDLVLGVLGTTLRYQVSRRLLGDQAWLHVVDARVLEF